MSMQDPISDMLTRIRNAQKAGDIQVRFPASRLKAAILAVLKEQGYILGFEEKAEDKKPQITVNLKYYQGKPVIERIKRVSTPGLRVYRAYHQLPTVLAGMGIAVVSTPKGVMTAATAKEQRLGGEVLCTVE